MSTAIDAPTFDGAVEDCVVDGFISLLNEVNSEEIAAQYDIGFHSKRIDFLEHVKIGLRLDIDNPNTLETSPNRPMSTPTSTRSAKVTSRN